MSSLEKRLEFGLGTHLRVTFCSEKQSFIQERRKWGHESIGMQRASSSCLSLQDKYAESTSGNNQELKSCCVRLLLENGERVCGAASRCF